MSEPEATNKKGGIAAVAAGLTVLFTKAGMSCGHMLSAAKPAVIAEEAARGLSHAPVAEDAAKGVIGAASHLGGDAAAEAAEKGGRGLVQSAGQASRRSELYKQDWDRIARSASGVVRQQARQAARNEDRKREGQK